MTSRVQEIHQRLTATFAPKQLEIEDQSHLHAGHAGARGGGGHFAVSIVSDQFAGKTPLQRHRMVNAAVSDMMRQEIHALSITARTPEEQPHG